jgi:hypothetical protein
MKQMTNNKTMAKGQNRESLPLTPPKEGSRSITLPIEIEKPNGGWGGSSPPPLEGQGGGPQNKGKGPPGRVRSPGAGWRLRPDNQQAAIKSSKIDYKTINRNLLKNKYQMLFNNKYHPVRTGLLSINYQIFNNNFFNNN